MEKNFAEIVMNPIRQRIAQYLIINKTGTVNEIASELSDIPKPSLYRHMKILLDAGCLEVIEKKAVRGTIEKTYALVQNPLEGITQKEVALLIQNTLTAIIASFLNYFSKKDVDPAKDMLSVSSSSLLLSDEEFMEMLGDIGKVYNKYIMNKPKPGRKVRNITIISAPTDNTL